MAVLGGVYCIGGAIYLYLAGALMNALGANWCFMTIVIWNFV